MTFTVTENLAIQTFQRIYFMLGFSNHAYYNVAMIKWTINYCKQEIVW